MAIFGALLNGVSGALIGFAIGCGFDAAYLKNPVQKKIIVDVRLNSLMLGAFILQISEINIETNFSEIKSKLIAQFDNDYIDKRMHFFRELLQQRIQVEALCNQLKETVTISDKTSLITFLFNLAAIKNVHNEKFKRAIKYIAHHISLPDTYVNDIALKYQNKKNTENEFELFGLTPSANYTELKRAYYQLAKKYHPDSNNQLPENEKRILANKFRMITAQYEKIKQQRGFK